MKLRKQKPGDADEPNLVSGTQILNLSHTSKGQEVLGIPRYAQSLCISTPEKCRQSVILPR